VDHQELDLELDPLIGRDARQGRGSRREDEVAPC
jgi:hypothetical protein